MENVKILRHTCLAYQDKRRLAFLVQTDLSLSDNFRGSWFAHLMMLFL